MAPEINMETVAAAAIAGLVTAAIMYSTAKKPGPQTVNPKIHKDKPKVVDTLTVAEIEDLVAKAPKGVVSLCRCWRSSNFPFCDGSHNEFNKSCGDNTGPLCIKKGA